MGRCDLDELTTTDLAGRRPVLVVPVGSCEQHGPHLPLGTDTAIATAVAARAIAMLTGVDDGVDVVVTPALTITASGEHQGFPGTLSIGTVVMEELVVELVRSADWARGVVLVNGHGGNRTPVDAAVARLRAERRRVLAWWPDGTRLGAPAGDLHAGRVETSMMLALAPDQVELARAPGPVDLDRDGRRRLVTDGVHAVSPSGVVGDPAGATAEEGEHFLAALAGDLADEIERARTTGWP